MYNTAEYCAECVGVVDTMEALQYLLLVVTIIVIILIIILMELSFVTDEKSQIALLKAIGFTDTQIIKWQKWQSMVDYYRYFGLTDRPERRIFTCLYLILMRRRKKR